MAQEHMDDNAEMTWSPLDVTDISKVAQEIRIAQRVVSANMRRITIDDMDGARQIVTTVGNIVQLIHEMVMSCSIYKADYTAEYNAMAIVTDEIQCALWTFHQGLLDHRLRMLDLRRKYARDRERTGLSLEGVESGFMLSMYIASYEAMILATCDTMKAASQWHHNMAIMSDSINMAASYDAAAELDNADLNEFEHAEDVTDPLTDGDDLGPLGTLHSHMANSDLASSAGEVALNVEQVCEITSTPKSPIDV
uniref:Uncharacterized protein n=1 Tax=viral metagenome TaxID=1070528 RepID=A0A2V0RAJ1_9ZZZZ